MYGSFWLDYEQTFNCVLLGLGSALTLCMLHIFFHALAVFFCWLIQLFYAFYDELIPLSCFTQEKNLKMARFLKKPKLVIFSVCLYR